MSASTPDPLSTYFLLKSVPHDTSIPPTYITSADGTPFRFPSRFAAQHQVELFAQTQWGPPQHFRWVIEQVINDDLGYRM